MLELKYDEKGFLRLSGRLQKSIDNVKDMKPAWTAVDEVLSLEFQRLFDAEGAYQGPKWSRLAPSTVKARQRLGQVPIKIGTATGRLAESLIDPTRPDGHTIHGKKNYVRGTRVSKPVTRYQYWRVFDANRPIGDRLIRGKTTLDLLLLAIDKALFGHMGKDK